MSLLRLSVTILCWVMTLNLATCADLHLWKYSSPASWQLGPVQSRKAVEERRPQEAVFSDDLLTASPPDGPFSERTSGGSGDSLTSLWRRSLSSQDWTSDPLSHAESLLKGKSKDEVLDFSGPMRNSQESIELGDLDSSTDLYKPDKSPISEQSLSRISRRNQRVTNRRQSFRNRQRVVFPLQSYGATAGIFWRFVSHLRAKYQVGAESRIVPPIALSKSHRNTHLRAIAPLLCAPNSVRCYRRQALSLKRNTWQEKKNVGQAGASREWPSSYLLGGALGRR